MIGVLARGVVAAILFAFGVAGCGCGNTAQTITTHPDGRAEPEVDAVPTPTVILGNPPTRVRVQLARTAAERSRGLMYVQNLPVDDGMLFIFPREDDHEFWMKNTLIPLDMIFIRADWTVAGVVHNAVPLSEEPRGVGKLARFVLEVNGGWAAAHGVVENEVVQSEGFQP